MLFVWGESWEWMIMLCWCGCSPETRKVRGGHAVVHSRKVNRWLLVRWGRCRQVLQRPSSWQYKRLVCGSINHFQMVLRDCFQGPTGLRKDRLRPRPPRRKHRRSASCQMVRAVAVGRWFRGQWYGEIQSCRGVHSQQQLHRVDPAALEMSEMRSALRYIRHQLRANKSPLR